MKDRSAEALAAGIGAPDYRALFAACPLPTFVWRRQGGGFGLVEANAAARELAGGDGVRPGATPAELCPDLSDLSGLEDDLRRCLDEAKPRRRELACSPSGRGPARHLSLHCAPVPPDMVMLQVQDVTERKEAEALREEVERIARHDLKSPLNIVVGVSNLLKDEPNLKPDQRESLQMIESAGYSMLNLINVSMDIRRIERGEYEYEPRPVDLADMARQVAVHMRLPFGSRGLRLEVLVEGRPASTASAFIAPGDEALCQCLLEGLARCAMHLSARGGAVRIFMDRAGEEVVLGARFAGHLEPDLAASLLDGRRGTHTRLPSEADLRNAGIAAQAMGGRLDVRATADETVITATLPA